MFLITSYTLTILHLPKMGCFSVKLVRESLETYELLTMAKQKVKNLLKINREEYKSDTILSEPNNFRREGLRKLG